MPTTYRSRFTAGSWDASPTQVVVPILRFKFNKAVAFNVLLPRTRWFWPLAILGNLSAWHGLDAPGVPVLSVYL